MIHASLRFLLSFSLLVASVPLLPAQTLTPVASPVFQNEALIFPASISSRHTLDKTALRRTWTETKTTIAVWAIETSRDYSWRAFLWDLSALGVCIVGTLHIFKPGSNPVSLSAMSLFPARLLALALSTLLSFAPLRLSDDATRSWLWNDYQASKDAGLTTQEKELRATMNQILAQIIPDDLPAALDQTNHIADALSVLKKLTDTGNESLPNAVAAAFSDRFGGQDLSVASESIITESIGHVSASLGLIHDVRTALSSSPIETFGNDEQKERFLSPLLAGEIYGAYCQTEPGAGSDVANLTSYYEEDGDDIILTGKKTYITVGTHANFFIVFARTKGTQDQAHKTISAFIVPANSENVAFEHMNDMVGNKATGTANVSFDGVRIPKSLRLGEKDMGFTIAMNTLQRGRISITSLIQSSLEVSVEGGVALYERALKKPMSQEMKAEREEMLFRHMSDASGTRALLMEAARIRQRDPLGKTENGNLIAALAKLYGADRSVKNAAEVLALAGMDDPVLHSRLDRNWRDARLYPIGEGTTEVMRHIVKQELTHRGKVDFEKAVAEHASAFDPAVQATLRAMFGLCERTTDTTIRERIERRIIDLLCDATAVQLMPQESHVLQRLHQLKIQELLTVTQQYLHEANALMTADYSVPMAVTEPDLPIFPDLVFALRKATQAGEQTDTAFEQVGSSIEQAIEIQLESTGGTPASRVQHFVKEMGQAGVIGAEQQWDDKDDVDNPRAIRRGLLSRVATSHLSAAMVLLEMEKALLALKQLIHNDLWPNWQKLFNGSMTAGMATLEESSWEPTSGADGFLTGRSQLVVAAEWTNGWVVRAQSTDHKPQFLWVEKDSTVQIDSVEQAGLSGSGFGFVHFNRTPAQLLAEADRVSEVEQAVAGLENDSISWILFGAGTSMIRQGNQHAHNRTIIDKATHAPIAIFHLPQVRELLEDAVAAVQDVFTMTDPWQMLSRMAAASSKILQVHGGEGYSIHTPINDGWRGMQAALTYFQSLYASQQRLRASA